MILLPCPLALDAEVKKIGEEKKKKKTEKNRKKLLSNLRLEPLADHEIISLSFGFSFKVFDLEEKIG